MILKRPMANCKRPVSAREIIVSDSQNNVYTQALYARLVQVDVRHGRTPTATCLTPTNKHRQMVPS